MGEDRRLKGLSLFSGIGGIDLALKYWVKTCSYCEIDPYCQAVLKSRFKEGTLDEATIYDDVCAFRPREPFDIIFGGFPCQDISVAGARKGLEGKRSGLFFEIVRLAEEIKPTFLFLENVKGILSKGGLRVVREIAELGYDCRWGVISAQSVGAPHLRERWFMLARHSDLFRPEARPSLDKGDENSDRRGIDRFKVAHSEIFGCEKGGLSIGSEKAKSVPVNENILNYWHENQSPILGVDDGVPRRLDRIRCLGNAVVPQQTKKAFEILMGLRTK